MSSSSLEPHGRHVSSLSDLPVELLDIILGQLSVSREGITALGKALRLNKSISLLAIKHMYQNPTSYISDYAEARRLFDTLLSSTNGTTYNPYHLFIEEFSASGFRCATERDYSELVELLVRILECKNLRSLSLSIPRDLACLAYLVPNCDLAELKTLVLHIHEDPVDIHGRMKALTSRMRLQCLEIIMYHHNPPGFLDLPRNTLTSVSICRLRDYGPSQGIIQALLSSHSQSLKSISILRSDFSIEYPISLPNLRTINVRDSRLGGWDNICGSLKSLESLSFDRVIILGTPAFVPDPAKLKSLVLYMYNEYDPLVATWCDENYTSLSSLRILEVGSASVEALANILNNCPALVEVSCGFTEDEHLQVLSRLAPASLQSLCLNDGKFSSHGLSEFVAAFPSSITRLSLFGSFGLTPSNFRLMLQLPSLKSLELCSIRVDLKNRSKLEEIVKNDLPPGLRIAFNINGT